jgi:hypothetical protein
MNKKGKDRGKHDGGRDASGATAPGQKHPESPENTWQPESGSPVPEERDAERRDLNERRDGRDDI